MLEVASVDLGQRALGLIYLCEQVSREGRGPHQAAFIALVQKLIAGLVGVEDANPACRRRWCAFGGASGGSAAADKARTAIATEMNMFKFCPGSPFDAGLALGSVGLPSGQR